MIRHFLKTTLFIIALPVLSISASETIKIAKKAQEAPRDYLFNFFGIHTSARKIPKDVQHLIVKEIDNIFCPFLVKKPDVSLSIEADSIRDKDDSAECITISNDNKHIAYVVYDTCTILNIETLEKKSGGCTYDEMIDHIAFNHDDTKLALLTKLGTIKIIALNNYEAGLDERLGEDCTQCSIRAAHDYIMSFTPQNKVIIANSDSNFRQIALFHPETEKVEYLYNDNDGSRKLRPYGFVDTIKNLSFNADVTQILCSSTENGLESFSLADKKWSYPFYNEEFLSSSYSNITCTSDNKRFFYYLSFHIQQWDLETKELISKIEPMNNDRLGSTTFLTPNEKYILIKTNLDRTRLYHIKTGKLVVQLNELEQYQSNSSYLSNDGSLFTGFNNDVINKKSNLLLYMMNPFWEQLETLLLGKILLEQVLFIKFIKLLKNQGLTLTNVGIKLSPSHLKRTTADDEALPYPTTLSSEVIGHLIKLFNLFEDPIKKYLKLHYQLHGFNKEQ